MTPDTLPQHADEKSRCLDTVCPDTRASGLRCRSFGRIMACTAATMAVALGAVRSMVTRGPAVERRPGATLISRLAFAAARRGAKESKPRAKLVMPGK